MRLEYSSGITGMHIDGSNNQISSVKDIIDYYKRAKEQDARDLYIKPLNQNEEADVYSSVIQQLQEGNFIPDPEADFFEAERWRHPHFQLKASPKGFGKGNS